MSRTTGLKPQSRYLPRGGVTETIVIIHPFAVCGAVCTDGANPENGLTIDASGNLYGTTDLGGGGRWRPPGSWRRLQTDAEHRRHMDGEHSPSLHRWKRRRVSLGQSRCCRLHRERLRYHAQWRPDRHLPRWMWGCLRDQTVGSPSLSDRSSSAAGLPNRHCHALQAGSHSSMGLPSGS